MFPPEEGLEGKRGSPLVNDRRDAAGLREEENRLFDAASVWYLDRLTAPMHFRITSDANQESGVGEVVCDLSGPTRKHFVPRDYGSGLPRLAVVLMCRDPALNFKRRVRFAKKNQTLYMDVMLHLPEMVPLTHHERCRVIIQRMEREISEALSKYNFADFDRPRFESDLQNWFAVNAA